MILYKKKKSTPVTQKKTRLLNSIKKLKGDFIYKILNKDKKKPHLQMVLRMV